MTPHRSFALLLLLCVGYLLQSTVVRADGIGAPTAWSNWMGDMLPVLGHLTLLDISLPGTHDTLTYDLSTIISLGSDDGSAAISEILHLASELGITPSDWIRNQSKTQGLDITSLLDNGVRFIDLRMMYTSGDWFSLHFMQSNQKVVTYLQQIRSWLDAHPNEIVVLWLSRHGSPCSTGNDQYPDVTQAEKSAIWGQFQKILNGLIVNVQEYPVNSTSISKLIQINQRVVIYATDYVQFTGSSPLALDGCLIDNTLCGGLSGYNCVMDNFKNATSILARDKKANKFYLLSMASSGTGQQIEYSFFTKYIAIDRDVNRRKCAATFNVPGMTDWCPPNLQDISQLTNYYNQLPLEFADANGLDLPNAIYLDAVDADGTIRTGTSLFPSSLPADHETTRYSYVAVVLSRNWRLVCRNSPSPTCTKLKAVLAVNRQMYPLLRWNDTYHGRLTNWPVEEM